MIYYVQNCIDEDIRLLCISKAKDRSQSEEENENNVLDEIKQEHAMKHLVGKPIENRKLASTANNFFLVNMEGEKLKYLKKSTGDHRTVLIWSPLNVILKFLNII